MKSGSATLKTRLYNNKQFVDADLVSIFFASGTQRFTTDRVATTIGADVFSPAHLKAPEIKQGIGSETEVFDLVMGVAGQTVAGVSFLQAAVLRLFNHVRVLVQRATITPGMSFVGFPSADLQTIFDGVCVKALPRRNSSILLRIQGPLSMGKVPVSRRQIHASCPFSLGDAACGVVLSSFRDTRTLAAGTTAAVIKLSSASSRAATGAVVDITSGTWAGASRVIRSVSGVDCTMDVPFPGIEVGATITVTSPCDKQLATCTGTFANQLRMGGMPNAPSDRK